MPNSTDKLDLQSPDLVNENIEKLAALFPNCVTEGAEGKAIDFDLLKQELNHDIVEGPKERYRLEWPGKKESIVTANLPTTKTLRPVREDSVNFDTTENLYIEGDNLEVLKILQESYLGKIKMIYIDPPYNTGKDFVYKDNFTQDSAEYKEESGQVDEYGARLVQNPETAGRYHSLWLTMMYPRLKLARNLLSDTGLIFISIDDGEQANLKKLCDEIYGAECFIANIMWQKKTSPDARMNISPAHDHILVYAKRIDGGELNFLPLDERRRKSFTNPDKDPRGDWASVDLTGQTGRAPKSQFYSITTPSGEKMPPPEGRCWAMAESTFKDLVADNRIWFGKDGGNRPRLKKFLSEAKGIRPWTWWDNKSVGHNQEGSQEVKDLFDGKSIFDNPKPVRLLQRIVQLTTNENSDEIILDFFSGSASLAHAVFAQSATDKINRKFIMIQLPESLQEGSTDFKANSTALKEGYKLISDIGKERIRRAATKIKEETGADIDYGFKVYKVDSSNMQDVYYKPQDYNQGQLEAFADNIKPDRSSEDLLTQILLDWGLPLTAKTETLTIQGKEVFKIAENSLMACFANGVDEALAKELAQHQPLRVVFKDSGFKDDTAKENVKQLLKQLSPNTEMKVI
ncbi:site-specific DNA-methyltransferase [Mangrovimonas sp. ST2L15]|uniref:site-specific DNA-methyltransferase n=1 Tax=Mangrovimonas sp. ST2L15 TaxID=1645916 RepID=UPI0006B3FB9F|nr:site-specific DNA-methyltransferase [Mangrovimonas sp. ST2L15]